MQISEILRKIAELTDLVAQDEAAEQAPKIHATATIARPAPVHDEKDPCDDTATMVSPLQQEHELLKKSQGVDNKVADFAAEDDEYSQELVAMKQAAGIGEEQQAREGCSNEEINPRKNAALAFHKERNK